MTDLLVTDARLLDLTSGDVIDHSTVRVEGGRIVDVALEAALPAPDQVPVVDAAGRILLPGLIDAHVHAALTTLDLAALAQRPATRVGIESKAVLEGMLRRGFTTVRDAGGLDRGMAEALAAGLVDGPRVFRSGRVLSQTGGHGDTEPSRPGHVCAGEIVTTSFARVADGVDAVRRAAREELKDGADQLKIMAGGGVASPTDPVDSVQYTVDEIRAVIAEASARRTYAFAHAYVPDAIVQAAEAGVRSIEHGNLLDDVSAKTMATYGTFLVPTLVVYEQVAAHGRRFGFPESSLAKVDEVREAGARAIELALRAGVPVGFGTDLIGEAHGAQGRELLLRSEVQASLDVLRSATLVNADLLGRTGELGTVAVGAQADLLLVDGDPLETLDVLTRPGRLTVIRGGRVVAGT